MIRIKTNNLELHKEIIEKYTKCSSNMNTTYELVERLCKDLSCPISLNYCYVSDLLAYLLQTTEIILTSEHIAIIEGYMESCIILEDIYFKESKIFNELIEKDVLPYELKNLKIDWVLHKIKESRGE